MTLAEYISRDGKFVLFFAGIGTPTGSYIPLGHPDIDFAERLLELTGEISSEGDWLWDGQGQAFDDSSNSIRKLHAYSDSLKWDSLVEDFESGN